MHEQQQTLTEFIVITGLSGSGKSAAIKCFEDLGFYCVDNLPANLIPTFVDLCTRKGEEIKRVALIIDIRERNFLRDFPEAYHQIQQKPCSSSILFLEASDEALLRRFSETRRPHPLAFDRPVLQGITEERTKLQPIRDLADIIIDTSTINIHELRDHINKIFSSNEAGKPLVISILSFGYKHGIPFNSDILFDTRFLPNPYFVPALKDKTGRDPEVKEFVFGFPQSKAFMEKVRELLLFLLPRFAQEGKTYLTISIGCTGGKHRSVAIAEHLEAILREQGYQAQCKHRDIGKE
jgi:UPF0042 nucleotide-binding protein